MLHIHNASCHVNFDAIAKTLEYLSLCLRNILGIGPRILVPSGAKLSSSKTTLLLSYLGIMLLPFGFLEPTINALHVWPRTATFITSPMSAVCRLLFLKKPIAYAFLYLFVRCPCLLLSTTLNFVSNVIERVTFKVGPCC